MGTRSPRFRPRCCCQLQGDLVSQVSFFLLRNTVIVLLIQVVHVCYIDYLETKGGKEKSVIPPTQREHHFGVSFQKILLCTHVNDFKHEDGFRNLHIWSFSHAVKCSQDIFNDSINSPLSGLFKPQLFKSALYFLKVRLFLIFHC